MSPLKINQVIEWTVAHSTERELYRIVWRNEKVDKIWLIRIPAFGARNDYCRGPFIVALSDLQQMLDNLHIVVGCFDSPPLWQLPDGAIRTQYSRKDGRCPTLDARDMRWSWIRDLFSKNNLADIFEAGLITRWVPDKAKEVNKARAKIYDALHIYLASGSYKNSLLMDWYRCGGKGKQRVQKQKLGRPNAAVVADPTVSKGYFLTEEDKRKLRHGWKYFFTGTNTVYAAFLEMSGVFYRSGVKEIDGKIVPVLLPPSERPTLDQFIYWGPMGDPAQSAWRKKLGQLDWAKKYKGISGGAKDGIVAVGQLAFCDTTSNDCHLISITSRLKAVGTLNRLELYEAQSELIFGFYCGFEPPSYRTFLLAVAHGASSKVAYFARFGIDIRDEDCPALAVKVYLGDNGEYRSAPAIDALTNIGAFVEWAASGHAELKGPIEGHHHRMHARLDHTLDGTTRGKMRKRGQKNPVLDGCLTYYEYMREYLREVMYYNTEEIVDHLLTVEMRREQVKPTRIEIYRWLVKKGYVVDFAPDISILRAHLLPALPALLTETGIHLLREDRGDKIETIWGLRYMADYLVEANLLSNARKNGTQRITVRGNPADPRVMWWVTEKGLIELHNAFEDPILYTQGTVQDCIAIQDDGKIREICRRGEVDQRRSDIVSVREANLEQARAAKKEELDALPERPSKKELVSGIEANRKAEMDLLAQMDKQVASSVVPNKEVPAADQPNAALDNTMDSEDPARQALKRYLKTKECRYE